MLVNLFNKLGLRKEREDYRGQEGNQRWLVILQERFGDELVDYFERPSEGCVSFKAYPVKKRNKRLKSCESSETLESFSKFLSEDFSACSDNSFRDVSRGKMHSFIYAAHEAFSKHLPLEISPDIIWSLIVQGVSTHINFNSEKYRDKLVFHSDKKTLTVIGDGTFNWPEILKQFEAFIRENSNKEFVETVCTSFSTSTPINRVINQISLMDCLQSYYAYEGIDICGIPEVYIKGTEEDWLKIVEALDRFDFDDLDWWLSPLKETLTQILKTVQGKGSKLFWNSFYKYTDYGSCAGGEQITGWINHFFPYSWRPKVDDNLVEDSKFLRSDFTCLRLRTLDEGLAKVPIKWDHFGEEIHFNIYGGFVGVSQSKETYALKPELGWFVTKKKSLGGEG